jgi:hypothetical protein
MAKIKMLRSGSGSDVGADGVNTGPQTFLAGQEYEVSDELARTFCEELKWAVRDGQAAPKSDDQVPGPDKFDGAPENKAEGRGPKRRK